jgi:ABC-type transport system involved in cytochrome bd biosynthesis fused ATPase/permease subunit
MSLNYSKNYSTFSSTTAAFQPVTYSWEDIKIELMETKHLHSCLNRQHSVRKNILDSGIFIVLNIRVYIKSVLYECTSIVTGCVQPGDFLAIMGASGAGKTTLLNCLTFRNTGKLKIRGGRYLNGVEVNTDILSQISSYVQQNDLFIPTLTVKEHLQFQVRYK